VCGARVAGWARGRAADRCQDSARPGGEAARGRAVGQTGRGARGRTAPATRAGRRHAAGEAARPVGGTRPDCASNPGRDRAGSRRGAEGLGYIFIMLAGG
jgi:hypothetical protein